MELCHLQVAGHTGRLAQHRCFHRAPIERMRAAVTEAAAGRRLARVGTLPVIGSGAWLWSASGTGTAATSARV
jgi:hypothetical protein